MIKIITIIFFFTISTSNLVAQFQQPKWVLNGIELDLRQRTPRIELISLLHNANGASGSYYGKDDIRLFYILDNLIFWGNDTMYIGKLFEDITPDEPDLMENEMIIIPKNSNIKQNTSYYVFYILHTKWRDITPRADTILIHTKIQVCYNEIIPNKSISPRKVISTIYDDGENNTNGYTFKVGMALSNFLSDGTRRLYVVSGGVVDFKIQSKIQLITIGIDTINNLEPHVIYENENNDFGPGEVELSFDNTILGFSCFKKNTKNYPLGAQNNADVVLLYLNKSDGLINKTAAKTNNTGVRFINFHNNNKSHFTGFEFYRYNDGFLVGKSGTGIYNYDLLFNTISFVDNSHFYSNSSIELTRHSFLFAIHNNNKNILSINSDFMISDELPAPISLGAIKNAISDIGSSFIYSLPDQVDGYKYPTNN